MIVFNRKQQYQFLCYIFAFGSWTAFGSEYVESSIESDIVPGPVEYAVLLPNEYDKSGDPYPLLLNLQIPIHCV